MRVIPEDFRRTRNLDAVEHFKRGIVHLRTVHIRMKTQGFLNLFFDGIHRVKRGHRLLKNNRDLISTDLTHIFYRYVCKIFTVKNDLAAVDISVAV